MKFQPNCVANAWMCAWTARINHLPVRMAVTKFDANTDHVQAEAQIDGAWVPLTNLWDVRIGQTVETWTRHYDIEPYRYLTLEELTEEQFAAVKGE